jgi:hypothetical protein
VIGEERVTPQRAAEIGEHGRAAVSPAPPIAGIELRVMSDTTSKLRKGDVTRADADAVVTTLTALRVAMN